MTEHEILTSICDKQIAQNELISGPDWKKCPWNRYLWLECAEVMDYLPWKNIWWNKALTDQSMFKIELVDVFIFGVSQLLSKESPEETVRYLEHCYKMFKHPDNIEKHIEHIAATALGTPNFSFDVVDYVLVMKAIEWDFTELYRWYLGKTVLNRFRFNMKETDEGYNKSWGGFSDNDVLVYLLENRIEFATVTKDFEVKLYQDLKIKYEDYRVVAAP